MCLLWWVVDKLPIRLCSTLPPAPCWHISQALLWRLNHIRSLMSVSGCICKVIKITALIKPQVTAYCSNPKFGKKKKEKKKESGFNNRKTACVTFDPMSINAGETEVLLPAFYLKQRVFGREVLPMQSSRVSFARLLLILAKVSMWILSVCLKWSKMNEKSIITTFPMQRGFPANIWKIHDLSPPRPSVPFGIRHTFFAQLLIIARNNLSFMNCIPRCEMVKRVFRFMPPPQPSLSACYSATFMWSIWDAYGWSPFWLCLSRLTAHVSLRSAAFPAPHGWCGRAPYNRAGGWGHLSAIILLNGGGWEGFNSVESGYSIFAPTIQLLHPPHVPQKAAAP